MLSTVRRETFFAHSFSKPWPLILDICILEFCFSEVEERGEGLGGHRGGGEACEPHQQETYLLSQEKRSEGKR